MERPNLKICIENDGDSDSDEDKPIIEVFEETKATSETMRIDKNTILEESRTLRETDDETTLEVSLDHKTLQPQPKRYPNKAGEFVTGFDPLSKEHKELREKRAQRFGIKDNEKTVSVQDLKALYESLGINEETVESGELGIRLDAIHVRGVDKMSTQDVFKYFQGFAPGSLEWIDDTSCNVVWMDRVTAARAMIHMSRAITHNKLNRNMEQKSVKKNRTDIVYTDKNINDEAMDVDEDKENGSLKSVSSDKEHSKKEEEIDDELNLLSENDNSDEEMTEDSKNMNSATESQTSEQDGEKQSIEKCESDSDKKTEEKDDEGKQLNSQALKCPVPPGKWRRGLPYLNKANVIYMRYATKEDKKQPGAAKKSLYYRRYGNPNFGGMKGLISESRKRKIIASRYRQEALEAKKVIMKAKKVTDIPEETAFDKHVKEAVMSGLKSRLKPKGSSVCDVEVNEPVIPEDEDECVNIDDELHVLLAESSPSPKKRTMRMYADDVEEELKKSRSSAPHFTESAIRSRLKDARELVGDARSRITGRRLGHSSDSQTSVGDLRNILGRKRRLGDRERYRSYDQMTLEVDLE